MKKQYITRKGTFDSGHRVMNERMKCFNMHGHTYLYELEFEFNEIGLKTKGDNGLKSGRLLTHFIFHPVQKNADQTIQIVYTLRVRAG